MRHCFFLLLFHALLLPHLLGQASPSARESAFIPLFPSEVHELRGPLPTAEFFFRVPEHIKLQESSMFVLRYQASPLLLEDVSTATFLLNGSPIYSIRLPGKDGEANQTDPSQAVSVPLKADQLNLGWNRLEVQCLLQTTQVFCRDVDNPACWFLLERGTGIELAYTRSLLFPELSRFPASVTEEQLLRQKELVEYFPADEVRPVVAILLPETLTDPVLQGLLVSSARLGQSGPLRPPSLRIGKLADWNRESGEINGLLVGLRNDLAEVDLPVETRGALSSLQPGEGLLAEIIAGEPGGQQRRWILLSGIDEEGLTRAVLTLGSKDALDLAYTNPWTVQNPPMISSLTEQLALPVPTAQSFQQLQGGALLLRGVFHSQASLTWSLPPGFETAPGSELILEMSHAGGLARESAFEVEANDLVLPGIPLNAGEAKRVVARVPIPAGLPGRDPNNLTINSYLDIGATDCAHRSEERAWIKFSKESFLKVQARPLRIQGLDRLGLVLLRDAFLRRAVVLLPTNPTEKDLEVVGQLGLHLGKMLPSMPVLWPEAAFYSDEKPVRAELMENRSALLLGSSSQWQQALPADTRLSVTALPGQEVLRLQGREIPYSQLTDSLVFAQFLPSPWSVDNCVIALGGIHSLGGEIASRLLTVPELQNRLDGSVAGIDSQNRIFNYETRAVEPESLAERVNSSVPPGLTLTETQQQLAREESLRSYFSTRNIVIASCVFVIVLVMIRIQMRLMELRAKRRRENLPNDSA